MERAEGTFVSEAILPAGQFVMMNLGAFPGLKESICEGYEIHGEVFDVKDIGPLDCLEGYPRFYNRRLVDTTDGDTVWVYYLNDASRERRSPLVASGNWQEGLRI